MSAYPKLMRHGRSGVIVKFTANGIGTVVGEGNNGDGFSVGQKHTTWNMFVFIDYKPDITKCSKEKR